MIITLQSKKLKVVKIKNRTTAKMFKNLKTNDKILISIKIEDHGTYAPKIKIKNLEINEEVIKSINEAVKILNCFEFEEIE